MKGEPPLVQASLCAACGAAATARSRSFSRALCPEHAPAAEKRRAHLAACRPLSPEYLLVRVPVSGIGAFVGAAAGMAVALVVGAALHTPSAELLRAIAVVTATSGAIGGVVIANALTSAHLRGQFADGRAATELPTARTLNRAQRVTKSASISTPSPIATPEVRARTRPAESARPAP